MPCFIGVVSIHCSTCPERQGGVHKGRGWGRVALNAVYLGETPRRMGAGESARMQFRELPRGYQGAWPDVRDDVIAQWQDKLLKWKF
jgi:hypothetical protein